MLLSGGIHSPEKLSFASVTGEYTFPNTETEKEESQTVFGFFDAEFIRADANRLTLNSTGQWFALAQFGLTYNFLISESLHFVTQPTPQAPSCQIALKVDNSSLENEFGKYIQSEMHLMAPYIYGSDHYYDILMKSENYSTIKNLPLMAPEYIK